MLISKNWLSEFITISDDLTPEDLALKLTMSTVEVEGIHRIGGELNGIVVGRVESVQKHPDADTLQVCTVDIKKTNFVQVVCGGSNLREGMLVAFAPVGAKVRWHGEGELVELKKVKIRGVESYGMICASEEVGLGELFPKQSEKEILDLTNVLRHPERPKGVEGSRGNMVKRRDSSTSLRFGRNDVLVGTPLSELLGLNDVVFEIDNKSLSNRPDLWGHYGIAREISALLGVPLQKYAPARILAKKSQISNFHRLSGIPSQERDKFQISVEDTTLCPRYMGVVVDGIDVGPSPEWMQARLRAVGLRPINNIVDITNFVMFDVGQPMHSFDASRLETTTNNNKQQQIQNIEIVVRKARKGESILALDEKTYKLTPDMLVIADSEKPIAIAGVMGGEETGVTESTKTLIFESANFDPVSVRRTATALGIRTESSARFEKSLDPNLCELALRRAVELTLQCCPNAKVVSRVSDVCSFSLEQGPITLPLDFVTHKIGIEISKKEIVQTLERLGFGVKEKRDVLLVTIPTWRATKDISIAEDVVEEIARMYGFENIPVALPHMTITRPPINVLLELERTLKEYLAYEHGLTEVYNYSFVSPQTLNNMGEDVSAFLELDNPIAKDKPVLRRHLLPNMLENVEANLHRFETVRLFEIGRVFHAEEKGEYEKGDSGARLPKQDTLLSIVLSSKGEDVPYYDVSSIITQVIDRLGFTARLEKAEHSYLAHNGRFAHISVGDVIIGFVGELHPRIAENMGIPYRVGIAEMTLDTLALLLRQQSAYMPIPQFPSTSRDVAIVVNRLTQDADVVREVYDIDSLVKKVELFDVYQGKNIARDKKSMAYRLTYRSDTETLKAEDVDAVHKKVVEMLQKTFGADVR